MADDMGYSDLGSFGGEIRTPNLDRLAFHGLRFTNFYSENMCWVSRSAMLTGVYHKASNRSSSIHPRCPTLAEALHANGYQTLMSGKWHLAGKAKQSVYPNDRGFDNFYGILNGAASFFRPASLVRNKTNVEAEADNNPNFYLTDTISDEAQNMIRHAAADRPVFLYLAYTAAHWPLHARPEAIAEYEGHYKNGWDDVRTKRLQKMKQLGIITDDRSLSPRHPEVPAWDDEANKAWQQRRMEVYAAQVTSMDQGIGNVIQTLKDTGRFENTLILFTIDNGGCHVEYTPQRKGVYLPRTTRDGRKVRPGNLPQIMPGAEDTYQSYGHGWANASNTPYRMFKQYDHEGGIRTPMIAHWPNGISSKGKIVTTVSHLIDVMPTILDVTNTTAIAKRNGKSSMPFDGHSIAGEFSGKQIDGHETLFFHHANGRALRHGGWKIVRAGRKQPWELYNLTTDPLELNDLAAANPAKLKTLERIWTRESERLADQARRL